MAEYIDKEVFRENLEVDRYGRTDIVKVGIALDRAKVDMPSAVAVVYCKDCKNFNTRCFTPGGGWCEAWDGARRDNFYCNYGKRKDNDT